VLPPAQAECSRQKESPAASKQDCGAGLPPWTHLSISKRECVRVRDTNPPRVVGSTKRLTGSRCNANHQQADKKSPGVSAGARCSVGEFNSDDDNPRGVAVSQSVWPALRKVKTPTARCGHSLGAASFLLLFLRNACWEVKVRAIPWPVLPPALRAYQSTKPRMNPTGQSGTMP
jgi:hypothetical protein